jgi:hypothetical protein
VQTRSPHPSVHRRRFLKLLAAACATASGAYLLYESTPWVDYDQAIAPARRPIEAVSTDIARKRELVRYATLAANGHNTQPWRFAIHEHAIAIYPDFARRVPVVDPHDRELWISLGCALENLLVAARTLGYAPDVTYPEAENAIHVRLSTAAAHGDPLFDAIPLRQTTRSAYDGQPIPRADLRQVQAVALEPGVMLQVLTDRADRETVVEYLNQGNLSQYGDPAFVDELIAWLRFNKREALASLDGLFSRCSGNLEVPRWLGQRFLTTTTPQQQAEADARKLRSSPAAVVISAETDTKSAWVRTGQVFERLALMTTARNIKSALLNQPIEVPSVRAQFQSAVGLGSMLPQLVVRLGYANALPCSPRRPVEHVIVHT